MKIDVPELAKVAIDQVHEVTAADVRALYAGKIDAVVLEVATQDPAKYWRVGQACYLDDPHFGEVVALNDLRYSPSFGLHSIHW